MTNAYRSMQPMPPCWCRDYPAGTIFTGWEESAPFREIRAKNGDYWAKTHTSVCLQERERPSTIQVISYDRPTNAPRCKQCGGGSCWSCSSTGREKVIKLWRWKTKPLLQCYFLIHRWEIISRMNIVQPSTLYPKTAQNYSLEVCRCGAEKLTTNHAQPDDNYDMTTGLFEAWMVRWSIAEITNRTAAWPKTSGTHSGGPR
jgi:hypothetical protein